ncbi:hypothetical protein CLF_108050 [Clonorchis sinensis]|uniref:Uncharacterized protein n=1 Tax=Clonorchis sinensis TaxID=79923 RepID=G7YR94_CLOSI|nr:hypothetical protein CLF_108050 [Clonorchis sinensis]
MNYKKHQSGYGCPGTIIATSYLGPWTAPYMNILEKNKNDKVNRLGTSALEVPETPNIQLINLDRTWHKEANISCSVYIQVPWGKRGSLFGKRWLNISKTPQPTKLLVADIFLSGNHRCTTENSFANRLVTDTPTPIHPNHGPETKIVEHL